MQQRQLLRSHGLPGAIGSLLLAIGALGMGWLPPLFNVDAIPLLDALRTTAFGEFLSRGSVLVGGAMLVQSWLLLGTDVLSERLTTITGMHRILALWLLPTLFVPPLFSRDPYSYFVQGKLMLAGIDPYTHGAAAMEGWFRAGVDPMWAETPTPYGPLYLLIERAVVAIAHTPYWSAVGFRLVAVVGIALIAYFVPRLAKRQGINPAAALWLAALNPLVMLHFALGAHNDALMVGLMLAGLHFATSRNVIPAVLLLASAVAVKPIAVVLVPFAALLFVARNATAVRRISAYAVGGLSVLAVVVALGLATGVGTGWIHALTTPGEVRTWLSPPTAIGMAIGLVGQWLGNYAVDPIAVQSVRLVFIAAALVACAYLLLRPERRTPIRSAVLAFTVIIFFGPVVQPWYLLWALPLIAVSGLRKPWHLKAVVIGTAIVVVYGLSEPTATSDAHLDLIDSLGILAAIASVALAVLASPRERSLALGTQFAHGLAPRTEAERERARQWVVE